MHQETVIAAVIVAGIGAADLRPRRVDRAAPQFGVEEATDLAEMLVRLAPHGELLVAVDLGELLARLREAETEMLGQPRHVALVERDDRIGTAIAGALRAIVSHDPPLLVCISI